MKRILATLVALAGVSSFGATVNWGIGASYYETTRIAQGAATAYLVYLGNSSSWEAYGTAAIVEIAKNGSTENASATSLPNGGASGSLEMTAGSPYAYVVNEQTSVTSVTAPVASNFGLLYVKGTGNDAYYYTGSIYSFSEDDSTHYNATLKTFTWKDDKVASNASASAQGWTPVPEPSTAALALAGLALLLKRRKA
jgi:hypothetical protein